MAVSAEKTKLTGFFRSERELTIQSVRIDIGETWRILNCEQGALSSDKLVADELLRVSDPTTSAEVVA